MAKHNGYPLTLMFDIPRRKSGRHAINIEDTVPIERVVSVLKNARHKLEHTSEGRRYEQIYDAVVYYGRVVQERAEAKTVSEHSSTVWAGTE